MAPVTDLPKTETLRSDGEKLELSWSRGLSLTTRILAVNLFVLALLAGGLFFLDSYRGELIERREAMAGRQVEIIRDTLPRLKESEINDFLVSFSSNSQSRVRIYDSSGRKMIDSFQLAPPVYELRDPDKEGWEKKVARFLDRSFDFLVRAPKLATFREPAEDVRTSWPELEEYSENSANTITRLAPDFIHVISAGARTQDGSQTILTTSYAQDIRLSVRAERFRIAIFSLMVLGIAILLSLFLARTIVRPLRYLAHAAVKVRLGRAQEVTVPRLPSRRDEIGMLARALSDMSTALRQRIDATEAFAADVAHEIKNPLASLRSALDGVDNVTDAKLKVQLMDVAKSDVRRMDRLISDISEASRVDSQLAKAKFELIDVGDMVEQLLQVRERTGSNRDIRIAFARPRKGVAMVFGEDIRLERVVNNLIDNAVSFSPSGGLVEVSATRTENQIVIRVSDEGPGVPQKEREAIFRRFHTERPAGETFGQHSGLGLAIARTIVEGHEGEINVHDREDGLSGACFEITLPTPESKLDR